MKIYPSGESPLHREGHLIRVARSGRAPRLQERERKPTRAQHDAVVFELSQASSSFLHPPASRLAHSIRDWRVESPHSTAVFQFATALLPP